MKAVMDAFTDRDVEKIVVKSAAQVGKSEVLLNVIGRYAQVDPATIMIIQPTLEMAQDFSKSRLSQLINETKVLKPLFLGDRAEAATRNSNQTILSKFFMGGRIVLAGANSPAGLASRPIRILLADEIDRFPPSASTEGDPLSIALKRTTTYAFRKILVCSTPTTKDISRIDVEYELGTQERWAHQCPNCKEYSTIEYKQINEACEWVCPDCGYAYAEQKIKQAKQKYIAGNKEALQTGVRSFYISGFYSPWVSWATIMREWNDAFGRPELEQVVYNTRFGLSYERHGEFSDENEFVDRLEEYDDEVPRGVLLLTAGVDVQGNRLEYEIVGWGRGEESWGICRGRIEGSPQKEETWAALDAVLDRPYRAARGNLTVARTFVDSGFLTSEVYQYCAARLNRGRLPIKGYGSIGRALVFKSIMKHGVPLILLGVNEGKAMIFSRLKIKEPGVQYMHYGRDDPFLTRRYDSVYFKQLTAEHRVLRQRGGMVYEMYEPVTKRSRNEALDCRVYALAAMKMYNIEDWGALDRVEEDAVPKKRHKRSMEADIW